MRRSKVKVGMIVALNERVDAQLYEVEAIDNFHVTLSDRVSGMKSIGSGDCSSLRVPTPAQIALSNMETQS